MNGKGAMTKNLSQEVLLQKKEVIEEIKRHLWIESEKAGHDIGFENAAKDWLEKYSRAWMEYHMPRKKTNTSRDNGGAKKSTEKKSRVKAKSYI